MSAAHYRERAYVAARAQVATGRYACWKCGAPADTVDHVPAIAAHDHEPGCTVCTLRPACATCNYAAGGRTRRRRNRSPLASRRW